MIWNAVLLAFRQISRNYLRAFLTMLGIIIGVGSVIVMLALGNGTTQMVRMQIASLGSNLLIVFPARGFNTGGGSMSKKFTKQEVEMLHTRLQYANKIAPISSTSLTVQYAGLNTQTTANGITEEYFEVSSWEMSLGRVFKDDEMSANVCILGESVRSVLFKKENPLGEKVRIGKSMCEVIGVLKSKGQGGMGNDQDDVILLPFKTFLRDIVGISSLFNINRIMISLKDGVDSSVAVTKVKEILRDYRHIKPGQIDTFEVMDTKEIEQRLTQTTKILTIFLSAVAGVSLIVGGIGIMNIMLVSVTERTKEIGTRLAIGALESDVLLQFLIESVVVSALGGIIGIILAFFISWWATMYMEIPFIFDLWVALGAFSFSAIVGIVFGYLPAMRASRLDPIEALRYE
ncbi:multidrug ABC transporter substrate-binding protein [Helicobacter didelphidarum]|uniref:Multidrug ABC transporter substrate-binding protein n=1 Tax=Helicobacter didelphidarum TaxID=2040648 RepID=A0A3D8IP57_9HELI|nr:ABC transporter permease [Helicobacter didelphidarum]RDU67029.1 multidrug ABC transporter substrate-binding protein [Helicobacter didelphidarum]